MFFAKRRSAIRLLEEMGLDKDSREAVELLRMLVGRASASGSAVRLVAERKAGDEAAIRELARGLCVDDEVALRWLLRLREAARSLDA
jgi:hypothetical protein